MYTNASERGIGCVLTQGKNICGIHSEKLIDAESRYTIIDKED